MYAYSLVIPLKKIKNNMFEVKTETNFDNKAPLEKGLNTLAIIRDWSIQIEHAISEFIFKKEFERPNDDIIKRLINRRINEGFEIEFPLDSTELDENSNRIEVVEDQVLIPVNGENHGARNWHQVIEVFCSNLSKVVGLSDQIHQRSTTSNDDYIEIIYWLINSKLEFLHNTLIYIRNTQNLVASCIQQNVLENINTMGEIASNITGSGKNA